MDRRIRERASQWRIRLDSDDVSEDDKRAFAIWCAEDPRHGEAFDALSETLFAMRRLAPAAESRMLRQAKAHARERRRLLIAGGLAGAAATAAIVMTPQRYETPLGVRRHIALGDGSRVILNTQTTLDVFLNFAERRIRLERGEAYFEVVADASRAFFVEAGARLVRVMATSFSVRFEPDHFSIIVRAGAVEIESDGAPLRLNALQRLEHSPTGAHVSDLSADQVRRRLAWRSGVLSFDGETLAEAARDVSRHTGASFWFADGDIAALPISVRVRAEDLDGFIAVVEAAHPELDIEREGLRVHARRRRDESAATSPP